MGKLFGMAATQAWISFRQRHAYRAILTDGEHIGIPLALLLKLVRSQTVHVTIGHRLSSGKKRLVFRWLKPHTHLNRIALHSSFQYGLAVNELGIPASRLALVPYQVDTDFWKPRPLAEERMICSAGLEYRDYQTLFKAVENLDARVIGAASNWSRRSNHAARSEHPSNVEIGAFDYLALRELYARAAVVVVPLIDVDFQAGITTILEAMAMAKAVIVTHSRGQTDVVEDPRPPTRGATLRHRPISLLRKFANDIGFDVEPNGFYVPPGDSVALRQAIVYLLDHPDERARLGAAGRMAVERVMNLEQFVQRLRELVEGTCTGCGKAVSETHAESERPTQTASGSC